MTTTTATFDIDHDPLPRLQLLGHHVARVMRPIKPAKPEPLSVGGGQGREPVIIEARPVDWRMLFADALIIVTFLGIVAVVIEMFGRVR